MVHIWAQIRPVFLLNNNNVCTNTRIKNNTDFIATNEQLILNSKIDGQNYALWNFVLQSGNCTLTIIQL